MLNDILFVPINKIKKLIGTTTDTSGSDSAGTVMGKLNNIISNNVSSTIGNTTDTGGTATAGTVMGKLNGLIVGEGALSDKIATGNDFIKASTNYVSTQIGDLPLAETEILNISGKGFARQITTSANAGNVTHTKVYADDELIFDYHCSATTKNLSFGITAGSTAVYDISDMTTFVGGNEAGSGAGSWVTPPHSLHFSSSLRILAYSTATDVNNYVKVQYGLVG